MRTSGFQGKESAEPFTEDIKGGLGLGIVAPICNSGTQEAEAMRVSESSRRAWDT